MVSDQSISKKIVVLHGSPKGSQSITFQYIKFLQKLHPQYIYTIFNVSQKAKVLENKPERMKEIINEMEKSDLILWSFPLYYMLVHSGLKRFIEILFEMNAYTQLKGKNVAAISTSIKFYDHTAHNYIHAVSEDLGMNYIAGASFHMQDLMKKKTKLKVESFFHYLTNLINTPVNVIPRFRALAPINSTTLLSNINNNTEADNKNVPHLEYLDEKLKDGLKEITISIITDIKNNNSKENRNLQNIVDFIEFHLPGQVQRIDINNVDIKGRCMGCLRCGYNNKCLYHVQDGYYEFAEQYFKQSDLIFIASPMRDRFLTSRWQNVFERFFYNCHTPSLIGKHIGHIITGPINQELNLQEICIAFAEMHDATHVGFISDNFTGRGLEKEKFDVHHIEEIYLDELRRILLMVKNDVQLHTSRREGGRRIFRDEIYGGLNMVFQTDHRAYKKQKIYKTFPQKSRKLNRILSFFMRGLQKIPRFRKKMRSMMPKYLIMPYKRVLNEKKRN